MKNYKIKLKVLSMANYQLKINFQQLFKQIIVKINYKVFQIFKNIS